MNDEDSYKGHAASDPRAWYHRFGDDRDDALYEIDQESEDALRDLVAPDSHLNHGFEVLRGRGCTRVILVPSVAEGGGWRLRMHGRFDAYSFEMARMWRKLNEIGIPTYLYNADALADRLEGVDWVLVAPRHEYVDYLSGSEKFGRKVGSAIHLWEEFERDLVPAVEWMPLEAPELSETQEPRSIQ